MLVGDVAYFVLTAVNHAYISGGVPSADVVPSMLRKDRSESKQLLDSVRLADVTSTEYNGTDHWRAEYKDAIGVCPIAGLPVLPRIPINIDQDRIKWFGGEPMFLCSRCDRYRAYHKFDPYRLARRSGRSVCTGCTKSTVRKTSKVTTRAKAIGLDGILRFYCKLCGFYVRAEQMDPSRRQLRRSLCDRCHLKEFKFNLKRTDKYVRPCLLESNRKRLGVCKKCKGFSRSSICGACVGGAPPILGRHLYSGVPSSMFNVNAALLFTQLVPKQAKAMKTVAKTVPGSQLRSGHPGWVPLLADAL